MSSEGGIKVFLVVKDNKVVAKCLDYNEAESVIGNDAGSIIVANMIYTFNGKD